MKIPSGIFALMLLLGAAVVYAQGVSVVVVDYPREVRPHDYFHPVWTVEAGGQGVGESGIAWGTVSGGASMEAYPFRSLGARDGNRYTTSIKAFTDTRLFEPNEVAWIYFRAYAIVGGKAYLSNEESIYVYNRERSNFP
jgi:hypothetical protein